jgi:PAS domain S-box-containing protein
VRRLGSAARDALNMNEPRTGEPSVPVGLEPAHELASLNHALRETENRYRQLVQNLPAAVYTCDLHGRIQLYNQAAVTLWGRAPVIGVDEWCGSHRIYRPDGSPMPLDTCPMACALREGRSIDGEEIIIERPDGTRRHVLPHPEPLRDASGAIVGAVNMLVDVTHLKETQNAARASEERLGLATRAGKLGVWDWDIQSNRVSWSESLYAMHGVTREQFDGTVEGFAALVHPDDRARVSEAIQRSLTKGAPYETEFRAIRPDGEVIWLFTNAMVVRENGGATRMYGATFDITHRKRAEEELAATKDDLTAQVRALTRLHELSILLAEESDLSRCLQAILTTAAELQESHRGLISLYDPAEKCLRISASMGFDDGTLSRLATVIPGSASGACGTCYFNRERLIVVDTESDPCFECFRDLAREVGFRAVHSTPIITRSGENLGVLSVQFDRSQTPTAREIQSADVCARLAADTIENARSRQALTDAKEQAEHANRSKDKFLAVLSHELRTPLTPVLMSVTAMEMDPELPPALREDLAMIRRNVELETKLIDDLLDLSRITSGKIRLQPQPIDLNAAVRYVCGICRAQILEKGLRLHLNLAEQCGRVFADPARLQQVLWNVLKNAAKFTREGGNIWVSTLRSADHRVQVEVRDDGAGIAAAVLPKVFDAFEQGDARITRQFGGLGLGLAISKALIELHGGAIRVASAGLGAGSTFTMEFPAVAGDVSDEASSMDSPGAAGSLRKVRLLIVEDHVDTAKTLGRLLRHAGYSVETADNVASAIDLVERLTFDVLVSDIGLPDGTGYELMHQIAQRGRSVRAIAMSGFGMDEDVRKSHEAGFSDHLVKPISIARLEEAIERVMRR